MANGGRLGIDRKQRLAVTENKLAVRENKGYIAETGKQAWPMGRKAGHRQKTTTGSDWKGRLTESVKEGLPRTGL
jgi:hypothetical protein